MFLCPIRAILSVVGYQVLTDKDGKSCTGAKFMSVGGDPISVQEVKAYAGGEAPSTGDFDITYYDGGAFLVLTWCSADDLVKEDGETPCGYAGWGDPETGIESKKSFKLGEMFLVQPYCDNPTLNIAGSVKQYSSDLAIASVPYDTAKVATGSPFPVACAVQEIKAFTNIDVPATGDLDITYYDGGAFLVLTWCSADDLVKEDGETPCGYAGWGDPETGIESKKSFAAAEGFLLQPYCESPSLGFVNPFYKGDK